MFTIKTITKEEIKALLENKIVFNTKYGIVDEKGYPTGYYCTRHKAYIEDRFADMARDLVNGAAN